MTSDPESKPPYHLSEFGVESSKIVEAYFAPMWRHAEHSVEIPLGTPTAESQALHERMNAAYRETNELMKRSMFGGEDNEFRIVPRPSRFSIIRERIADAWSVLLGREHIGGDY